MSEGFATAEAAFTPDPWYRDWRFPLLPKWRVRPASRWSRTNWSFGWLFFSVWSSDAVYRFGVWAEIEPERVGIQLHVPLAHIRVGVPLPFRQKYLGP